MSMQEAISQTREELVKNVYPAITVLELSGTKVEPIVADGGPQSTPPVPFQTHTRSGEGYAQINDDQDQEHLYE